MPLVRVDWSPDVKKIRQFGGLLALFAVILGLLLIRRGRPAGPHVLGTGVTLGSVTALWPHTAGRWIYKAWMSVAFVMGTIVSFVLLGFMYYAMIAPLALLFRLIGRDVLSVRRPAGTVADAAHGATYWTPVNSPDDPDYYERLF